MWREQVKARSVRMIKDHLPGRAEWVARPSQPAKSLREALGFVPPESAKSLRGVRGVVPPESAKSLRGVRGVVPPESAKSLRGVRGVVPPESAEPHNVGFFTRKLDRPAITSP